MAADTSSQAEPFPAEHILVQHVLVGFQGSVPGKNITRTQAQAEQLANEILTRAKAGEDFGTLVQQYTDDAYPGVYAMANDGVRADTSHDEYPRAKMAAAFGNVGFAISPGNVDMAPYHMQDSPFGWHVIKRLR